MRAFLIDFENVKSAGLAGIEDLTSDDHVIILYSANSNTISFEMHQKILESKTPIEYFQIRRGGKNSLDFQLSSLLGWMLAGGKYSHLFIISNDNGFDALPDFWTSGFVATDCVVKRYHTIGQAAASCKKAEKIRPEVREPVKEEAASAEEVTVEIPTVEEVLEAVLTAETAVSGEEISAPVEEIAAPSADESPVEETQFEESELNIINVIDLFSMPTSPKKRKPVSVKPAPKTERRASKKEKTVEPVKEEPAAFEKAPELPAEPVPAVEEVAIEAAPAEIPAVEETAPAGEAAPQKEKPARKKRPQKKEKAASKKEADKPAETISSANEPTDEAPAAEEIAEPVDEKTAKVAAALPAALSEIVTAAQKQRIAADVADSKGKQDFYREIIRRYGQKKGLEIYKTVKSEYSNLKKLADGQ